MTENMFLLAEYTLTLNCWCIFFHEMLNSCEQKRLLTPKIIVNQNDGHATINTTTSKIMCDSQKFMNALGGQADVGIIQVPDHSEIWIQRGLRSTVTSFNLQLYLFNESNWCSIYNTDNALPTLDHMFCFFFCMSNETVQLAESESRPKRYQLINS